MHPSRRKLLQTVLFGSGLVGLKSLVTGVPLSWFREGVLHAEPAAQPSFLLLSTVSSCDPVNANAPGSFVEGTEHLDAPELAATDVELGSASAKGAARWAAVPQDLRARMSFIHHRTNSNAHPEFPKVQALFGAAKAASGNGQEMVASLFAQENAKALGTIQTEPVPLGGELISFQSRPLANIRPSDLKGLFVAPEALAAKLQELRDTELDAMYATLKANGNRYQRTMLDRYALARTQTRQLGDGLAALLTRLPLDPTTPNTPNDQLLAAIALFKLKVAPAVTVHLPFGGDNHNDADLADELEQTVASIGSLEFLWSELAAAELQDRVTFASFNTFGRTLKRNSRGGRDHNGGHHVMLLFGPKIRGSVVGGLAPEGNDFAASAFDAASGAASATGDVQPVDSLASAAKTLGTALGVGADILEHRINSGKVITAALTA